MTAIGRSPMFPTVEPEGCTAILGVEARSPGIGPPAFTSHGRGGVFGDAGCERRFHPPVVLGMCDEQRAGDAPVAEHGAESAVVHGIEFFAQPVVRKFSSSGTFAERKESADARTTERRACEKARPITETKNKGAVCTSLESCAVKSKRRQVCLVRSSNGCRT